MAIGYSLATQCTVALLNGLASSTSVGWQSAAQDNTGNRYDDVLLQIIIDLAAAPPAGTKALWVYAYGGLEASYTNPASGTEGLITLLDVTTTPQNLKLLGTIPYGTSGEVVESSTFALARAFGGVVPPKWGCVLINDTGAAVAGSGNFVSWTGVYRVKPPSPPVGITVSPGQSLNTIVNAASPGAVITLLPGIHRNQFATPKTGMTINAQPGAVLNGAVLLTGWTLSGGKWFTAASNGGGSGGGQCNLGVFCAGPEDLFLDEVRQTPVGSQAAVGAGQWFFDRAAGRVWAGTNPTTKIAELSSTPKAFIGANPSVTLNDLVVEKYAPGAQAGAIHVDGLATDWTLSNLTVRLCHGYGLRTWTRMRINGGTYSYNGQMGIAGQGSDVVMDGTEISFNNTAGYSPGWEAGGTKFAFTHNFIARNCHVHHNVGPGLWWDIDNHNALAENNLVEDNDGAGIFYEISYDIIVRGNQVYRNGRLDTGRDSGFGGGIFISSSGGSAVNGVEIYNNIVNDNYNGITLWQQARGSGDGGLHQVKNCSVHDNTIHQTVIPNAFYAGAFRDGDAGPPGTPPTNAIFSTLNNHFENNNYAGSIGGQGGGFAWNGGARNWTYWVAQGNDDTGVAP